MNRTKRLQSTQRGTALVMSMVVLVILTILGLSAMRVSILETRMAGNLQDSTLAFQAAESGLAQALNTGGMFNINSAVKSPKINFGFGAAQTETKFIDFTPPKRGSKAYGLVNYEVANFDQSSTGSTTSGGHSVVHQGVFQVVNKSS